MILVTFYVLLCVKNIWSVYQEDPCRAHKGQCIDTRIESCLGGHVQKIVGTNKKYGCPKQPKHVSCCLKQPYQEPECSSIGGTCIDTNKQSCPSGEPRTNHCPTQPRKIKCCITGTVDSDENNNASPEIPSLSRDADVPIQESPCHDLGGRCIDITVQRCSEGNSRRNLCPKQPAKILCCLQSRTIDGGESSPETRPTIRPTERSIACGRVSHTTFIRGGRNSPNAGRWPWMVSLQFSNKQHVCGGVLIASNYVLTAAHCGSLPRIVLGDYDLKKFSNPNRIVRNLSRRIPHQDYHIREKIVGDNKFIEELRNDIAIYKLSNSVGYTDFIKPVCLSDADYTSSLPVGTECHIIGWGSLDGETHTMPQILQEAPVRISDPSLCRDNIFNSSTMICVANSGPSTCGGDSGGPLLCRKNAGSPWVVYGVTSYGPVSCNGKSVFTKVQVFRSWIQGAII